MAYSKWTFALLAAGALGLTSMTLATTTTAEAHENDGWRKCRAPVHAVARAGGHKPFYVKKILARMKAVQKWRRKTANRFGPEYRRWRLARAKDVHVERRGRRVVAFVRGKPCRTNFARRAHRHDRYSQLNQHRHDKFDGPRRNRNNRLYK